MGMIKCYLTGLLWGVKKWKCWYLACKICLPWPASKKKKKSTENAALYTFPISSTRKITVLPQGKSIWEENISEREGNTYFQCTPFLRHGMGGKPFLYAEDEGRVGVDLPYSLSRTFLVAPTINNLPAMQETWIWSLGWGDRLEKGMAIQSSIPAWRIPWTEEPGGL